MTVPSESPLGRRAVFQKGYSALHNCEKRKYILNPISYKGGKKEKKRQLEHLPEAVKCQVPQGVDMKAMGSGLQPINGPINQAMAFRQLQEAHHPLDLSHTSHHGNC